MPSLNQEIILWEDDTLDLEFTVAAIQYNQYANLTHDDAIWFACATTYGGVPSGAGNTVILQKANTQWDAGIYTGDILSSISTNSTDATTPLTQYTISNTSGGGGSAKITTLIATNPGPITYAYINGGGFGYAVNDTLTLPSSVIGGTTDVIITLTSGDLKTIPPPTGDISLSAATLGTTPTMVTVSFSQSDFDALGGPLVTGVKYYWELTAAKIYNASGNYSEDSQVIAGGTLQVDPSQFSTKGHRP